MKNIFYTLLLIFPILIISSCEEDSIMGCTDPTAINFDAEATEYDGSCEYESLTVSDQILGTWAVDSANSHILFPEDMLNIIITMTSMYTPEEFEEELGFPMPSSQTEWDEIALNGVAMNNIANETISGFVVITTSTFTINEPDGVTELEYQLTNNQTIEFLSDDYPGYTYYDIVEVNESNLVITTTTLNEATMGMELTAVIFLSKQ